MSILITSQTAPAISSEIYVHASASLLVSSGIAAGEDCSIQMKSEIDGWRETGEVLTSDNPTANITGPLTVRLSKPASSSAYGVEITQTNG